ncbi:MAG: phage tail protein [Myxococcota bacterium]
MIRASDRAPLGTRFALLSGREPLAYFRSVDGLNAELRQGIELPRIADSAALARTALDPLPRTLEPGARWEAPRVASGMTLVLRVGYIVTSDLQDWLEACRDGQYDRRDLAIILNDNAANEVRRWNLKGCWPKQWTLAGVDAKLQSTVFEVLTLVVEDMQIA